MGTKTLLTAVVVSATLLGCAVSPTTTRVANPNDDKIECKPCDECKVAVMMNKPDVPCSIVRNCLKVPGEFVVILGGRRLPSSGV